MCTAINNSLKQLLNLFHYPVFYGKSLSALCVWICQCTFCPTKNIQDHQILRIFPVHSSLQVFSPYRFLVGLRSGLWLGHSSSMAGLAPCQGIKQQQWEHGSQPLDYQEETMLHFGDVFHFALNIIEFRNNYTVWTAINSFKFVRINTFKVKSNIAECMKNNTGYISYEQTFPQQGNLLIKDKKQ